ncbi:protein kinase C theta type-like [Xenopus tropicalis]|uniref:Protein kinase C theta type-like n=1 Tax=Xenopus tropicalis TaxID=8364 RepID=A0A8J1IPM2_XENTR|nr:protein kinase C theta type-like [Xenopus tropicalis]
MDKGSQQEKGERTSVSEKEEFARSPHINLEKRKREVDEDSSETESSAKRLRIGQNIRTEEDIGQIKSQSVIEEDKSKKRERSCSNDGEPAEEEEQDLKKPRVEAERPNPCVISNYSFHMELGAGSFGKVMLASLPNTKKHVALKIIKKDDRYDQKRIKAEAQTLKITGECPFLCKGLAAFQSQLHAYLVMECESKTSLWDLIHSKEKLGMETVIFFSAELVVGLQFLHSRGIVHRDLKPDNILISKDGHIKIVDFGLVAEDVSKGMKLKAVVGNFKCRAPEAALWHIPTKMRNVDNIKTAVHSHESRDGVEMVNCKMK